MKFLSVLLLGFLLVGCIRLTDESGKVLSIGKDTAGFYVDKGISLETAHKASMFANVKGSVYETGEMMSVFGTCLDDAQLPVANTTVLFSAWYPNGTLYLNATNVTALQPGYYLYRGAMQAVQGTYLTEIDCYANVSGNYLHAAAWGEWQNPFWVQRINDTQAAVSNLSLQLGNLSVNMSNSFNITWNKLDSMNTSINASFYNLSSQIYQVGVIANASVDRNDSYLAQLIQNLSFAVTPSGALNYTEDADTPKYMDDWSIKVTAKSPLTGKTIKYPDAECFISTTQTNPAVPMSPQGSYFKYDELITKHGSFTWTVTCQYA